MYTTKSSSMLRQTQNKCGVDRSTALSLLVVWILSLTLSIHDAMFTRTPYDYAEGMEHYNNTYEDYFFREITFLPNRTVWESENRLVYGINSDLVPITIDRCGLFVSTEHYKALQVTYFIVCYILPSMTMIICYGFILRKLFTRRIMAQLEGVVSRTAKRLEATRKRHTAIIIILVSIYIALWGPYLTYKLYGTFLFLQDDLAKLLTLKQFKFFTNICLIMNPLIYMLSSGILAACCGKRSRVRKIVHNSKMKISQRSNDTTKSKSDSHHVTSFDSVSIIELADK